LSEKPPPLSAIQPVPAARSGSAALSERLLDEGDTAAIAALREEVLACLPHPDCYVREAGEAAFIRAHHPPRGETLGVFDGEQLVAYAMLGLPARDDPSNLGRALGLPAARRGEVAHLASCMVRPGWRGLGLQRALLSTRLVLARSHGRPLCVATVSPHNHASRHNMLRRGLHLAALCQVDGLLRQIALIDLDHGLHVDAGDERLIDSGDTAAQRAAFADGYVVLGDLREPGGVRLRFLRRLDLG